MRTSALRQKIASKSPPIAATVEFVGGLCITLGFITNDQNDIFKVLTIASIVGIPPTFVVGLYGMNFRNMPELNWTYGYEWGLFLVVLSIIVPVAWFKWRGWW